MLKNNKSKRGTPFYMASLFWTYLTGVDIKPKSSASSLLAAESLTTI
ncbi:hypothetical protein NST21_15195 [Peribacillus sp. FSL K6-1552]